MELAYEACHHFQKHTVYARVTARSLFIEYPECYLKIYILDMY